MSDNEFSGPGEIERVHGYEIKRAIVFENNRGFALAENPNAVTPFVTWQFTEGENGAREYYWGHYMSNGDTAARDYENRIAEYQKDYGFSERGAYKYYSTQRPIDIATFPKTENGPVRMVNFDKRESVEQGQYQAWGYLVYDAPLTKKQIDDYELRAAPDNPDLKAVMEKHTQVVGHWEEMKGLPESKRFTWLKPSIQAFALREPAVSPEQLERRYIHAKNDLTRAAENRAEKKSITEQLKEGAEQAARDNAARPTPAKDTDKNR